MRKSHYLCTDFFTIMESTPVQILQDKLWRRFHEGCQRYRLLADGDHILLGLSGGKDSLLLLELLGRQAKIFVPQIKVSAVHIRIQERNYLSDTSYLEECCQRAGVSFLVRDTEIKGEEKKDPCFLCSWYRRKALLDTAQELGCNKIALGHHRDDAVETLLMNLIYQGSFAAIPPKLSLEKMPLTWIRPLCLIDEKEIVEYARLCQYRQQIHLCPFEKESSRAKAKALIHDLETWNPDIRSSLWNAMENIKKDYLPKIVES